jgi:hypothetical protein
MLFEMYIKSVHDLLVRKNPPTCANDDNDDYDNDDDEYVPRNSNSNFNKATEEFDQLES